MTHRYQTERPLTLSEAKVIFGYTSDHLAYLCRNGFVWGQRHGRAWLTCESAVRDYKRALKSSGKPLKVIEQGSWLVNKGDSKILNFALDLDWQGVEEAWNRFVGFEPVPEIDFSRRFLLAAARERVMTRNRTRSIIDRVIEADLGFWLDGIIKVYQEAFSRRRLTPSLLPRRRASQFNFSLGLAPKNLPAASLPAYLSVVPWYRHELVLVPALGVLTLAIVVSQAALLNTFMF